MKLTKSQLKRIIKEELNKHQAEIFNESTDVGFVGRMFGKKSKLATQLMQQIADLKLDDDTSNWIESGDSSTPEWREKADKLYDLSIQARTILKPSRLGDGLQKKQARISSIEIEDLSDRADAAREAGDAARSAAPTTAPTTKATWGAEESEPHGYEGRMSSEHDAEIKKCQKEWDDSYTERTRFGNDNDNYTQYLKKRKEGHDRCIQSARNRNESKKLTKHTLTRILKEELKNL